MEYYLKIKGNLWGVALTLIISSLIFSSTVDCAQNVPKYLSQCGGDISSDSESLTFPTPGETLQPGDLCVWTIHLQNRTNFRFSFLNLNIGSNFTDCRDGSLRLYSLSNLSPVGQPEGHMFCNVRPPPLSVSLPNNVAVLILHVGNDNTNPGTGFNLSWTATTTDPLRTLHQTSFSTASQGIIKYPVVADYEPNLAATWLVKTVTPQETTRSDFNLMNLDFETCSNSNPCLCDALILYEISSITGILGETERFCGERSSAFIPSIESRFILAFFTDIETEVGEAGGFEVAYYPTTNTTVTAGPTTPPTTTTMVTTTTPPTTTTMGTTSTTTGPITDTPCGTILSEAVAGRITYKSGQLYDSNERCVWTIRIQDALGMTFTLIQSGIAGSDPDDGISISTFSITDPPLQKTEFMRYEGLPVTLNGSVAIVTFVTDGDAEGLGFILEYRATGFSGGGISPLSIDFISTSSMGTLDHPEQGQYANNEVSTFIMTTPNFSVNNSPRVNVTWTRKGLESTCYDYVVVYKFYPDPPSPFGGWSQYDLYCATTPKLTSHVDMLLYVFKTDGVITNTGFALEWTTS